MIIRRTKIVEIKLTVSEVSQAFCEMNADEQACFFNCIDTETKKWKQSFCFQLQSITDSEYLTDEGRNIMGLIGDYSDKRKYTPAIPTCMYKSNCQIEEEDGCKPHNCEKYEKE